MRGPAVTRSTLRQQIADALRDEVLAGRLHPGQEFTVKEIADQYGVSATPVREALVDLSAQGLLDSVQHRGFRVHEYSVEDYRGMIEARNLVADGIFRDLADRPQYAPPPAPRAAASAPVTSTGTALQDTTPSQEASSGPVSSELASHKQPSVPVHDLLAVRRRGEEAQRAACAGDLNVLIGYDLRFWHELNMLFGNPYLADFLHRLRVQCWVCAVPLLRGEKDLKGTLWSGHPELVDALLRRDPRAAHAVVLSYNAHSLALIERLAAR